MGHFLVGTWVGKIIADRTCIYMFSRHYCWKNSCAWNRLCCLNKVAVPALTASCEATMVALWPYGDELQAM
jgi:hypothetical protein